MSEVFVNGERYIKAQKSSVRIVVLHRGWVVVGRVESGENETVVRCASVVRRWGTTKGLGQIAANGPTSSTVLDPCGTVRTPTLAVVMSIDCEEDKWASHLS